MVIGTGYRDKLHKATWRGLESLEPRQLLSADFAIIDLGTLGGPSSFAFSINNELQVAGRSLTGELPVSARAFRWDVAGGMIDLGVAAGYDRSEATGINDGGDVVGTSINAIFDELAFLVGDGEAMIDLGTLGGAWSRAAGINNNGQVAGTSALAGDGAAAEQFHAFVWDDGVMTDLGTLGGERSLAKAISDAGHVVGLSFVGVEETFSSFVWSDGVMQVLGTLGGPSSEARDVNDQGVVVGDADQRRKDENGFHRFHAAAWNDGQVEDLGTLGGKFSSAEAINNSGQIVGWSETRAKNALGDRVEHAFIYDNARMHDLNDLVDDDRWTLVGATGINEQGYITGYGTFESDDEASGFATGAFVLRPLFADLVVEIDRLQLPDKTVPGDHGRVTVKVTNQGENDAVGRAAINILASPDESAGGNDVPVVQVSDRKINLRPGQSTNIKINFVVPANLAPNDYHFVAEIVPTSGIEESDATNNSTVTAEARQLVWMFGSFEGRRNVKLTVQDTLANTLRFSMRSKGFGQVMDAAQGLDVAVFESTSRSSVTIVGQDNHDTTGIHNVTINASLGGLDAQGVDLWGDLWANGSVKSITFDDVNGPQTITVGSDDDARATVSMHFDQVYDLNVLSQVAIKQLDASLWESQDATTQTITAPALGRLYVDGNVNTNLSLTGVGSGGRQLTLGKVAVGERITGGLWAIAGHTGRIEAAGIDADWEANVLGAVDRLEVEADMAGRFTAASIDMLTVGQDLHDAALTLGPTLSRRLALEKLYVGKRMERVTVRAAGRIGLVSLGAAADVDIFAGVRLDTVGLPTGVGDFDALASIERLRIRGLTGEPTSVANTNIAAWTVGSVSVSRAGSVPAGTGAPSTFAVAAHGIRSLAYRSDSGTLRLRRPDAFVAVPNQDVMVRII